MFVIKNKQLDKMSQALNLSFVQRAISYLNQKYPDGLSKSNIEKNDEEKIIASALVDAKKYGILFENDILLYLECIIHLGVDFDKSNKYTRIRSILNDKTMSGESKMNEVYNYIVFSVC